MSSISHTLSRKPVGLLMRLAHDIPCIHRVKLPLVWAWTGDGMRSRIPQKSNQSPMSQIRPDLKPSTNILLQFLAEVGHDIVEMGFDRHHGIHRVELRDGTLHPDMGIIFGLAKDHIDVLAAVMYAVAVVELSLLQVISVVLCMT